jgi:hypothetical protein
VIQKNQRSRQRELKRLDTTKYQHNLFHQSTVQVVVHNHNCHCHIPGIFSDQLL